MTHAKTDLPQPSTLQQRKIAVVTEPQELFKLVKAECSNTNWQFVDAQPKQQGLHNTVLEVIDNSLDVTKIFRFLRPTGGVVEKRSMQTAAYEPYWLNEIQGLTNLQTPAVADVSSLYHFFSYPKLNGVTPTAEMLEMMTLPERTTFARDLAIFFHLLHEGFSVERGHELNVPEGTWFVTPDELRTKTYNNFPDTTEFARARKLVLEIADEYDAFLQTQQQTRVIHSDVFGGNLLFHSGWKLNAVIDFSDMCRADFHYELKKLHRFGWGFMEEVCFLYEKLAGVRVNKRIVWMLALVDYMSFIGNHGGIDESDETFSRNAERLRHMIKKYAYSDADRYLNLAEV